MHKLVEYAKSKVGCGYVWGAQGQVMDKKTLNAFIVANGIEHYNLKDGTKAEKWLGKQCFDCSGLVVYFLMQNNLVKTDYSAQDLFKCLCDPIGHQELQPGDLVFVKGEDKLIDHVGVYIGDDQVIEAQGTRYGVTQTTLSRRPFNVFGRLRFPLDVDVKPMLVVKGKILDVDLVNEKGSFKVGVRQLFEAMGYKVEWDENKKIIKVL